MRYIPSNGDISGSKYRTLKFLMDIVKFSLQKVAAVFVLAIVSSPFWIS